MLRDYATYYYYYYLLLLVFFFTIIIIVTIIVIYIYICVYIYIYMFFKDVMCKCPKAWSPRQEGQMDFTLQDLQILC